MRFVGIDRVERQRGVEGGGWREIAKAREIVRLRSCHETLPDRPSAQPCTAPCRTVLYRTALHSAVRYSTVQYTGQDIHGFSPDNSLAPLIRGPKKRKRRRVSCRARVGSGRQSRWSGGWLPFWRAPALTAVAAAGARQRQRHSPTSCD